MAIRVGGTDVIDNSLGLKNIASVDATTADAISAAGVGGGKADFVASGTIANGDVVILNGDGTVTTAGLSPTTASTPTSTGYYTLSNSSTYDSTNNKVIIFYRDFGGTNNLVAQVGTVSGNTISFGSQNLIRTSATVSNTAVAYDATANKVLFFVGNRDSNIGEAYVGTISGTSISVGTATTFENTYDGPHRLSAVYDSNAGKVVVIWRQSAIPGGHKASVCTISGTSVTLSTPVTFATTYYSEPQDITFDSTNNKVVISFIYVDPSYARNPQAIVGTVSGSTISFGTAVDVDTVSCTNIAITFDSTNSKAIVLYKDRSTSPHSTKAKVGTVSGTSISFGTASTMHYDTPSGFALKDTMDGLSVVYDSVSQKVVVVYSLDGSTNGVLYFNIGTVSGSSISWGTQVQIQSSNTYGFTATYEPSQNKTLVLYAKFSPNDGLTTLLTSGGATNFTDTNLIGVSTEDISDTATGTINIIGGINESQTGLTTGTTYYAADDGSLSTTNNGRKVGKAISSTKLLVDTAMSGPEMNTYLGGLV